MPAVVDPAIIGSVADVNTEAVGISAGVAMGNLYQAAAQAMGAALLNCTNAQQQGYHIGLFAHSGSRCTHSFQHQTHVPTQWRNGR